MRTFAAIVSILFLAFWSLNCGLHLRFVDLPPMGKDHPYLNGFWDGVTVMISIGCIREYLTHRRSRTNRRCKECCS